MATKQQLAAALFCHTGVAIRELASSYHKGIVQESVRQFQSKWGQIYDMIKNDPGYHIPLMGKGYVTRPYTDKYAYQAGSTETGVPSVKGQYGAATAICMDTFVEAAFNYLGVTPPYYTEYGTKRILPWKASQIPAWYVQWKSVIDQMCPTGRPEQPSAPEPDPMPEDPDPRKDPDPIIPDPGPPSKPKPVGPDPAVLRAIAENVRWQCTPGFTHVFKHALKGDHIWVKPGVADRFRKDPIWDFVKVQYKCGPVVLLAPYKRDDTRILAGVGLAIVGAGALYWFWYRKRKKRK